MLRQAVSLLVLPGRMLVGANQYPAQVDYTGAVQAQGIDGRAACGRQADNQGKVIVPLKMILPTLLARMKKRNFLTAAWISAGRLAVFMPVATRAGKARLSGSLVPPSARGRMCSTENGEGEYCSRLRQYSQPPRACR